MTPTGRVAGKVALISGGARGQGLSHGRTLAREGAAVFLGDVLDDEGEAAAASLRADGLDARYLHLDVTQPADWDAATSFAERTCGGLHVVVNNAGVNGTAGIDDCLLEEWERVIAINQTGTMLGIQRSIPALRRSGGGSIVNISSVLGTLGTEFGIAYHASKAAVHLLTRAAAVTLAPDIRVNSITPGIIATGMADELGAERLRERVAAYPMGRAGRPDEVSLAVVFLAADESSFTTGADLRVDGGALAGVKHRGRDS